MIVRTRTAVTLVDREALAFLTKRSVHTIRLRCQVVRYDNGRALYAMEREIERLAAIPTRRRDRSPESS